MRKELFFNPLLLLERMGQIAANRRRLRRLRGGAARFLDVGHIDTLELLDLLKDDYPNVIYDIGANIGTWSILAKTIYPNAQIHAFEPLEKHIKKFKKLTQSMEGIHLHPVALGSQKGRKKMQVASFSDASSLLSFAPRLATEFDIIKESEEDVEIERLDDYSMDRNIPPPDLLKLDVQGYELEALRGAESIIKKARAVLTEVSFTEYYSNQCQFEDIVKFMAEHDYRIRAFGSGTPLGREITQTDVLFVRIE